MQHHTYKPYPLEWICLVAGTILTFSYSWIIDDAYVYFRYVDNLVFLDRGLVYNPGEFVEGFSSPAWALLLTAVRFLRINYWVAIRIIAVLSYIIFWALLVIANRRLSGGGERRYIVNIPLIHLSLTYGVLCYFSSGVESPLIQIAAAGYACLLLFPQSLILQILVGVSPLIRHELLLPFIIALIWIWRSQRRAPLALILTCILTLGSWMVFRIYYYADLLPNTFYLKDDIFIGQGLRYLYDTVVAYHTVPLLLLLTAGAIILKKKYSGGEYFIGQRVVMLFAAAAVTLYVIKIGGDPRHYRYLAFPYCLGIAATGGIAEQLLSRWELTRYRGLILGAGLAFALFTFMCYPRQLLHHPIMRSKQTAHTEFMMINDAAFHRMNTNVTPPLWGSGAEMDMKNAMVEYKQNSNPNQVVPVISIRNCVRAYRKFDSYAIQHLGLTEPFLARTTVPYERPAHKYGLLPLARNLVDIRTRYGSKPGSFQRALESGRAPAWVAPNIDTINAIESKIYNRHNFFENVRLAFTPVGRIQP